MRVTDERTTTGSGAAAAPDSATPPPGQHRPATARPAVPPPPADPACGASEVPQWLWVPRLTPGLQLLGEYQGSGFTTPRYLAQRADGQVLQLSQLLFAVASESDGVRTCTEVAQAVSVRVGRPVGTNDVGYLVQTRLVPAGVVAGPEDAPAPLPASDLLLSVKFRGTLLPARWVGHAARALAGLHRLPVVALVLGCWALVDAWLFLDHGAISSLVAVVEQPTLILAVAGLTVLALLVHELGHASACHFGGARPGRIGYGVYLVWPALYTDVTDVYRLGRAGRLRTDLGGVYFNVVFILVLAGCYAVTGHPVFLAVIYVAHFELLEQLLPVVRFDGYFVVGDLAGVPDLFGKVRPLLVGLLPGRRPGPEVAGLRRSARVVVTVWVLVTVPLLFANLAYAAWKLPWLAATAAESLARQADLVGAGLRSWDVLSVAAGAVSCVLLVLPPLGLGYVLALVALRLGRRGLALARRTGRRLSTSRLDVLRLSAPRLRGTRSAGAATRPARRRAGGPPA